MPNWLLSSPKILIILLTKQTRYLKNIHKFACCSFLQKYICSQDIILLHYCPSWCVKSKMLHVLNHDRVMVMTSRAIYNDTLLRQALSFTSFTPLSISTHVFHIQFASSTTRIDGNRTVLVLNIKLCAIVRNV